MATMKYEMVETGAGGTAQGSAWEGQTSSQEGTFDPPQRDSPWVVFGYLVLVAWSAVGIGMILAPIVHIILSLRQ